MSNEPLDPNNGNETGQNAGETRVLNIDNVHLHANDIDALRRLAEHDPQLAKMVVEQKDRFSAREHASYRFGVISALVIVVALILSFSFVLVKIGIILSLVLLLMLFVAALFVRVILTGEWSDTSAIGQLVGLIIHVLGGKPKD